MALTTAQAAAVKAFILADPVLSTKVSGPGTDFGFIADALNATASPNFTIWKSNVSIGSIGDSFVGTELAGLTSLNQTRLQVIALYSPNGVNPSLADRRAFFDDVFSGAGGVNTRARLLALWKRLATLAQKVLSTGTGSDASPATTTFENTVSLGEIAAMFAA